MNLMNVIINLESDIKYLYEQKLEIKDKTEHAFLSLLT